MEIEHLDLPHLPIHLPDFNSRQGTTILQKKLGELRGNQLLGVSV